MRGLIPEPSPAYGAGRAHGEARRLCRLREPTQVDLCEEACGGPPRSRCCAYALICFWLAVLVIWTLRGLACSATGIVIDSTPAS